jgi:putative ABC transport system substrate-binding protein
MRRSEFQIGLAILAAPVIGANQAVGQAKIPQLCFLTFDPGSPEKPSERFAPFFSSLAELGCVHGRSVTIGYFSPEGRSDQFPRLVDECLRLKPDAIAAATTPAALAAKAATSTVPHRHGHAR